MGVLRLFLALTVLDWHYRFSGSVIFPFSFAAVCCFFVISGFYMAMVINEKYGTSPKDVGRFYLNRTLRLYPINVVLLAAFAVTGHLGITHPYGPFMFSQPLPVGERICAIVNQTLIFPHLLWENLRLMPNLAYNNLIFGQFYTVGLELMFYTVAPFIVTRQTRVVTYCTLLAGAFHFGLHAFGLPPRPWQYEFFPGVLVFFLMGCLSYRLLLAIRTWKYPVQWGYAALPLFLGYCIYAHGATLVDFTNRFDSFGLYVLTALMLPFLFQASKAAKWDRAIGDLSYPVYAVHFLVGFAMVGNVGTGSISQNLRLLGVVLLSAIALTAFVEGPIEIVRRKVSRRASTQAVPIASTEAAAA